LVGLRVPQVPHHQLTLNSVYSNPRLLTFALQARAVGLQFDDDRNQFPLEHFVNLDGYVSRSVSHGVELFAAAENILNRRYSTAKTPVQTIAPPVGVRVGVRFKIGEK